MSDIVERLREGRSDGTDLRWQVTDIHREAADEIQSLRQKVEEMEAQVERLRDIVGGIRNLSGCGYSAYHSETTLRGRLRQINESTKDALADTREPDDE